VTVLQPDDPGAATASATTQTQIDDSFVSAAQTSEASGDYLGAASYWQSLLDREPTNLDAALGLAESLRHLEQYAHAIDVLNSALAHHPDDPRALGLYGRTLVQIGEATQAIAPLEAAAAQDPNVWETYAALGVAYGMVNQPEKADEANLRALAISPGNPKVLNNMGLAAAMDGNLDGAIDLLERAAEHDEADIAVRQNLALLLAYRGDVGRAEELARQDLPQELADRNIAFYRSIANDDIENIEDLVNQSAFHVEEEALEVPVADVGTADADGADLALGEPVEPTLLAVEAIEPEVEVVVPAEELLAATGGSPEPDVPADDEIVASVPDVPDSAPEETPEQVSTDDFALAPERVSTPVDDSVAATPQATAGEIVASDSATSDPILDLIGSITAPTPEAGDVAVIEDDDGQAWQRRSNSRTGDLPTDNTFDLQYLESTLEKSQPIAVQGDADSE
jgi:Flp pilus assembly protein TadD